MRKVFEKLRIPLSICLLEAAGVCLLLVNPTKHHVMKDKPKRWKPNSNTWHQKEVKKLRKLRDIWHAAVSAIYLESVLAAQQNKAICRWLEKFPYLIWVLTYPFLKRSTDRPVNWVRQTMKPDQKWVQGVLASHYSNAYGETLLFSPLLRAKPVCRFTWRTWKTFTLTPLTPSQMFHPKRSVLNETGEKHYYTSNLYGFIRTASTHCTWYTNNHRIRKGM